MDEFDLTLGLQIDMAPADRAAAGLADLASNGAAAAAALRRIGEVQGLEGGTAPSRAGPGGSDTASGDGDKVGRRIADATARSLAEAFEDAVIEGKPLKQAVGGLVGDLQSQLVGNLTSTLIKNAVGAAAGGDGWFGAILSSLFGFADGGVMTDLGPAPLKSYARGGVADRPQLALFGEGRTPEAFVPLPDGRRIPVQMDGAAEAAPRPNVVINMTVTTPDAGSFRRSEGQVGAEIAARLQQHLRRYG